MGEGLEQAYIERFGRRHWDEYLVLVEDYWEAVRAALEELRLDYHRVDLYQDGLPVCGRELEIVKLAAAMGSENHQLLMDLAARGATLMGTEDPNLVMEEYQDVQTALAGRSPDRPSPQCDDREPRSRELLARRDAYIGRRIGELLRFGRTAILFLGIAHNVEPHLPGDIVLTRLAPAARPRRDKPG